MPVITQTSSYSPQVAMSLGTEFAGFFVALKSMFESYHPERHYMRGPGPKWHAKHGHPPCRQNPASNLFLRSVR